MPRTALTLLCSIVFVAACASHARAGGCGGEFVVPLAIVTPVGDFRTGCQEWIPVDWADPSIASLLELYPCFEGPCARNGREALDCQFEHGYGCPSQILGARRWPGAHAGPVERGLAARFDSDSDRREGVCHAAYTGSGRRVIFVPAVARLDRGTDRIDFQGWAAFFLRERPDARRPLALEFLYDVALGCPE